MKPSLSPDAKAAVAAAVAGAAALSATVEQAPAAEQPSGEVPGPLAELLEKIPTPDAATVEDVFAKLVQGGPATVD